MFRVLSGLPFSAGTSRVPCHVDFRLFVSRFATLHRPIQLTIGLSSEPGGRTTVGAATACETALDFAWEREVSAITRPMRGVDERAEPEGDILFQSELFQR
jgi:hypothetical protein